MADNVQLSSGALIVATKGDGSNVQHQEVVTEFLTGGQVPVQVATIAPLPTERPSGDELLTAILVELRVLNAQMNVLTYPEAEPLDLLRNFYQTLPVTTP
jgi:hypothetical protein